MERGQKREGKMEISDFVQRFSLLDMDLRRHKRNRIVIEAKSILSADKFVVSLLWNTKKKRRIFLLLSFERMSSRLLSKLFLHQLNELRKTYGYGSRSTKNENFNSRNAITFPLFVKLWQQEIFTFSEQDWKSGIVNLQANRFMRISDWWEIGG